MDRASTLASDPQSEARRPSPTKRVPSARQREVLAYARRGYTNKAIAMSLDIAPSTVSSHLRDAMRRLGIEHLVALANGSPPHEPDPAWARTLTPAETEVASLASAGMSNAEIAARRGTSPRTVANQIASVLRKLALASRRELVVRSTGT